MDNSDERLKMQTNCGDISVCDESGEDKSSPTISKNEETSYSKRDINEIDNVNTHIFDDSRQELNDPNGCSSDVDRKNNTHQRAKINLRERKRMHDLNQAMEGLREVMPCASGPNIRKLSKIATLSLARNYIQMLTQSIEELKYLLDDAYRSQSVGSPTARRRDIVRVHPYRQQVGIRNVNVYSGVPSNFNNHYSQGFDRHARIYGSFFNDPGKCAGHDCCPQTNRANISRNHLNIHWNNT